MSRRPEGATVLFAVLGALLLAYLGVPLLYLFFRVEWMDIISTLGDPRALRAVRVSLITSVIATSIMASLGVPLGYVLARALSRDGASSSASCSSRWSCRRSWAASCSSCSMVRTVSSARRPKASG